jgi:hypothetical protein
MTRFVWDLIHRRAEAGSPTCNQPFVIESLKPFSTNPSSNTCNQVIFTQSRLLGPNLATATNLAKYNTVNQVDRLHGGTKPAHAVRE